MTESAEHFKQQLPT